MRKQIAHQAPSKRGKMSQIWAGLSLMLLASGGLVGCGVAGSAPPLDMTVHQQWQLQPGDRIAGYEVTSGLGDIMIELSGEWLYMPVDGQVQSLGSSPGCSIFSSAEIPAYRMRICGLKQQRWGDRKQGQTIGKGDRVALAMLRKQPDGTWAMVEPATELLEQFFEAQQR